MSEKGGRERGRDDREQERGGREQGRGVCIQIWIQVDTQVHDDMKVQDDTQVQDDMKVQVGRRNLPDMVLVCIRSLAGTSWFCKLVSMDMYEVGIRMAEEV